LTHKSFLNIVHFTLKYFLGGQDDQMITRDALQCCLNEAVDVSFNRISVDTDTSTSDTITLMSSNLKPLVAEADDTELGDERVKMFRVALAQMCQDLSDDVVRNGEGGMSLALYFYFFEDDFLIFLFFFETVITPVLVARTIFTLF
jgi:hypothetical protein